MDDRTIMVPSSRRGRRLSAATSDLESVLEEIQFLQGNTSPIEDVQAFDWAISRLASATSILKNLKGEIA